MYSKSAILVALIMTTAGATAGVSTILMIVDDAQNQELEKMPTFSSYSELSSFLDKISNDGWSSYLWGGNSDTGTEQQKEYAAQSPDYSRTNVQVEGIDEADVVKTDGEYIYSATSDYSPSCDSISIIKAYPPGSMSVVATICSSDLKSEANATLKHVGESNIDLSIAGLYVLPGRLIVVASVYLWSDYYGGGYRVLDSGIAIGSITRNAEQTVIFVYDITDIGTPSLSESFSISGYSVTSRMQNGVVYSVSQQYIWKDEQGDYGMPETYSGDELDTVPFSEIHYDPDTDDAGYYLNILAVDASELKTKSKSILAGWASTVYMSPDSLFLTIVKWPEPQVVMFGDAIVRELSADDDIPITTIYRVDVDALSMQISAKGDVDGLLLNQFSMDERNGYLRVATSNGDWLDRRNAVHVLNSNLTVIGSIEDIAVNETIQSSRFIGDTLYLVTFRQVDPLFVIDLSVPEAPSIMGELTVPGFSTYLHPVDADHILGIGSEGSSTKISLFDVSDPTIPKEISKYLVGNYSYSAAGWEHKAVLFDADKELLVMPVSTYDYTSWNSSSGFYVFKLSVESGISLRGIITHNNSSYWNQNDRALYIGDYLYTVSYSTVKANLISDLSDVGELVYRQDSGYYVVYGSAIKS